jgi:hypothetical protein
MLCAYSCWLLAMLLPSRCTEDLFDGWWRLTWDGEGATGRWRPR